MRNHLVQRALMNDEALEPLVRRTIQLERRAWNDLWLLVDPRIEEIAGRWRVTSRLSSQWDERRNIVVRVMERLQADGFERLKRLHQVLLREEGCGWPWIAAVTRSVALNYTRRHAEHLGAGAAEDGSRWAALVSLPDGLEDQLPESVRAIPEIDARRIGDYAEERLRPPQLRALRLWLTGEDPRDIASELGLANANAADLLVRAALQRLRYRFAGVGAPPGEEKNRPGIITEGPGTVSWRR